jgi:glycerol-3-phosphate dehydrogenase
LAKSNYHNPTINQFLILNRDSNLKKIVENFDFDIIVIGGGATGLGTAVDAAQRGYKTILLEQADFGKGTSSKATKLVHGGVRYLQQGNIKLVMDALRERGYLLKNAPHIATTQKFIIPCYNWFNWFFYGFGLTIYDILSGKLSLGSTKWLKKQKVTQAIPQISTKNLVGGIAYTDGKFDDTRLCINLAQTIENFGGIVLNYAKVNQINKLNGKVCGVTFTDVLTNKSFTLNSKCVINATGVFVDRLMQQDTGENLKIVTASQGSHIVVQKKFFTGVDALMLPKTSDGRVLFAVPWHNYVILGTTDNKVEEIALEPKPIEEEIDFILANVNKYLNVNIAKTDITTTFVGLRPLVRKVGSQSTAALNRDHSIFTSATNFISITGGKWTTYRKIANDVLTAAIKIGILPHVKGATTNLKIHGWSGLNNNWDNLNIFGSDKEKIESLQAEDSSLNELIHPKFTYTMACVVFCTRYEMAQQVEDVLARRLRLLFLDAAATMEATANVANIMAKELGKDSFWIAEQITKMKALTTIYTLQN